MVYSEEHVNNMTCDRNILAQGSRIVKVGAKGLQNTKSCALLLLSVMIVGILTLSPTFSSLMNTVVIKSTGEISLSSITAKSGSPLDIQTAVNAVAATGGGTVYIPTGTFAFNPPNAGIGVTIPYTTVAINIIGAGVGLTILKETTNAGGVINTNSSNMFERKYDGQSHSAGPLRISGISFVGFVVNESVTANNGIGISSTQDFRIDHCSFQDFDGTAIWVSANSGGAKIMNRGVIDHNTIDNPYKAIAQPHNASGSYFSLWGYGIEVIGDYYTWVQNMSTLLGQYYNTTTVNGMPEPQPIYIENNNFTRTRHAIASTAAGYYVSRYNYFQESAPYAENDVHGDVGGSTPWGGRGLESYGNVFNFTDESYSGGLDFAIKPRGGGGVAWNNTVIINPAYHTATLGFGNDGEVAPYDVEQFYSWNNTAMWTSGTIFDFNSRISVDPGVTVTQNVNYFLRAPNQTLDGFTYTPYTYPHPLTLQTTP
jgi:hypothetical protein